MADKIKKGDWNAQTTAILLIVAPILVMLFNSLGPVNATAGLLNFTFTPDTQAVIGAMKGNESNAQLYGVLLVISSLLIPLSVSGIARICQDDPGRKWAAFGFMCTVISVAIWAVTNGVTAALADAASSYHQASAVGAVAAAGAAGAAEAAHRPDHADQPMQDDIGGGVASHTVERDRDHRALRRLASYR